MAESNQTDEKTKTENSEEEYKEKVKVSPVSFKTIYCHLRNIS